MKAIYVTIYALLLSIAFPLSGISQNTWPRTITTSTGDLVKIYQWQPESFSNETLQASAAISILQDGKDEPVFGMIWLTAGTETNGQNVNIRSVDVTSIKLPDENDGSRLSELQSAIADGMSGWNLSLPLSELNSTLQVNQQQEKLSGSINNNPPKIIYSDKPSLLVVIDGAPKLQSNSKWGVQTVVNTPFIIIKNNDNKFYLYGGKHWYSAPSATGPYNITTNIPNNLESIQSDIAQATKDNNVQQEENDYNISRIIVSTEPAELLQSNGEPNFSPVQGTSLLYVKNSDNDIFMDVTGQQYYVLLSGRWYRSSALDGKWQYIASDRLPADFANIPEGSPKDNVLASVAGTIAAKDAVMDAQVPQTAKVDRRNASANIQYDGNPQFDDIDGTDMAYAVNTSGSVIRWRGSYYAVDNGVWFQSYSPMGPWAVSIDRPYGIDLIPPRYPVYSMKYVYIYDVTPDYVYMGYSRGYLNTFVYGPTVVYGTGYYYRPWYGNHYYARPYTWGFNMQYNPWTGWGFGFNYNFGWFNMGIGNYSPWGYWGGWWGPSIYRPSYCWAPYGGGYGMHGYNRGVYGSYYGRRGNTVIINNRNVYRNNNIYNNRRDVVTRDNRRPVSYRNTQSAPVRRFDNARPSERNTTTGRFDNARPSVRDNSSGRFSPRDASGRTDNRFAENQNNARPNRNFEPRSSSGSVSEQRNRSLENPRNNVTPNRQFAERQVTPGREYNNRPSQPSFNRQVAPRQENIRTERSNPVIQNRQPVQRFEQSRSAPQPRAESGGGSRPSGGERRAGRG